MIRKKLEKKIPYLKPKFQNILICKKKEHRPFLEILIEEPENVSRKNLGVLVGIFQINNYSEDSSYIVNYLISIIKKEYFSKTNRGPVENFEAALHKANLALSGLATHENIDWIGNLNAVCAIIEKNNILVSQTGTASAFLLRKTSLIEITENPLEQGEISPLKTFQDVISGKIEKDDKLIFTTKEIFELFSMEEIKKSALKFSQDNFIQFLNTALINELDHVATLVIDISQQEDTIVATSAPAQKTQTINAFSQAAFRTAKKNKPVKILPKAKQPEIIEEPKEQTGDFIDTKTGHIYMKEDPTSKEDRKPEAPTINLSRMQEKFSLFADATKKTFLEQGGLLRKSALTTANYLKTKAPKFKSTKEKTSDEIEAMIRSTLQKEQESVAEKPASTHETSEPTPLKAPLVPQIFILFQGYTPKIKKGAFWFWEKLTDCIILILRQPVKGALLISTFLKNKYHARKNTQQSDSKESLNPKNLETFFSEERRSAFSTKKSQGLNLIAIKKIFPDFSRLKNITNRFNFKQKMSALIILLILIIIPYWIAKWTSGQPEGKKPEPLIETPIIILPLEQDKNIVRLKNLNETYSEANIQKILILNGKLFALKTNSLVNLETQNNIPLPADFQNPDLFFGMRDLNLIFFIKNNKLTALATATGKFINNQFVFPEKGKIADVKTYLTYLYLLDQNNNQIYRYPRVEGGFGEKTAWLKENFDLANAKNLVINENVFILNNNEITKLFRGKKLAFEIEKTATPIMPDKLYTERDMTNLYILDKTNSRIIKLDVNGRIITQYYNEKISNVSDFFVSEENNLIYVLDEGGMKSFSMENTSN